MSQLHWKDAPVKSGRLLLSSLALDQAPNLIRPLSSLALNRLSESASVSSAETKLKRICGMIFSNDFLFPTRHKGLSFRSGAQGFKEFLSFFSSPPPAPAMKCRFSPENMAANFLVWNREGLPGTRPALCHKRTRRTSGPSNDSERSSEGHDCLSQISLPIHGWAHNRDRTGEKINYFHRAFPKGRKKRPGAIQSLLFFPWKMAGRIKLCLTPGGKK